MSRSRRELEQAQRILTEICMSPTVPRFRLASQFWYRSFMSASLGITTYCCPGEDYAINRSIHLARLAAFYPKCRECPHRGDAPAALTLAPRTTTPQPPPRAEQPPSLFLTEGIRGTYLNAITRQTAAEIAGAFAGQLWDELHRPSAGARDVTVHHGLNRAGKKRPDLVVPTVVIAYDERPAAPDIITGVCTGLRRMGCRVIDIGPATKPCLWFSVEHLQATAGVQATGVGCDPAGIGLDFVQRGPRPLSSGGTLDQIASRLQQGYSRPTRHPGSLRTSQVFTPYETGLWKHFHALRPLRIAMACPSHLVNTTFSNVFKKLACELLPIDVPVRQRSLTNPADPDIERLGDAVRGLSAHFGLLVEEDGQRCAFLDENGELVPAMRIVQMLVRSALRERPSLSVAFGTTKERSHASRQPFEQLGASVIDAGPTQESLALAMQRPEAVIGGCSSGHYWFRDATPVCDAVITLAHVLQALSQSDAQFSEATVG